MGLVTLAFGDAWAQPRARPDSLKSDRLLDRIDFHPRYSSSYDINRSSSTWGQNLSFTRSVGVLDFRNSWALSQRRDEGQNDLRQKRGTMTFNLDHTRTDFGRWTLGLEGKFDRASQTSELSDIVDNGTDLGLTADTKLLEQALHRFLAPMRAFSLDSKADFGYADEQRVNRRRFQSSVLRDTTQVSGVFQRYDLGLNGDVRGVSVRTAMSAENRSGDSETIQRNAETGQLLRSVKDRTNDRDRGYDGSLGWSPNPALKTSLRARKSDRTTEYWDAAASNGQGDQETRTDGEENGAVQIEWTPARTSVIKGEYGLGSSLKEFGVQPKDEESHTKRGSFDARLTLPALAGPLAGTEFQTQYSYDEARTDFEETSDYKQGNRKLRLQARRGLGTKLQLQLTQEMLLKQYFYDDGSGDRDERRLFTDGVLNYVPSVTFNALFNVNFGEQRSVAIAADKAGNNNTRETYKVSADVGYTRGRLNLTQRYTVQADYAFYDFNENNNSLTRSNEVQTDLRTTVGRALMLTFNHLYQHRDSGKYMRDRPTEPRQYAVGNTEIHHVLTLGTRYSLGTQFWIDGRQLFDRRQTSYAGSGRVSETKRVEFSLSSHFERKFSDTFNVMVDFTKTESNQEKDYWRGTAKVEKIF